MALSAKALPQADHRRPLFDDAGAWDQKPPGAGTPCTGFGGTHLRKPQRGDRLPASGPAGICQPVHPSPVRDGRHLDGRPADSVWIDRLLRGVFVDGGSAVFAGIGGMDRRAADPLHPGGASVGQPDAPVRDRSDVVELCPGGHRGLKGSLLF